MCLGGTLLFLGSKQINKRPVGLIGLPFKISFLATENLPKVKLGQVAVGSNVAQNTHLASRKSYLVIISPIHMKS